MTWESYSLDNYLNRELRFWKSLKAALINKGGKDKVLQAALKRYDDKKIQALAEGRFRSMALLLKLLKPKYRKLITDRVNKELGSNFKDALDLREIKKWQPTGAAGTLAWGWVAVAVAIAIVIIVIIAESNDNNGVQEDDTVIVTVGTAAISKLVETNTFLECEEIAELNYSSWATYLLMVQSRPDASGQYLTGLVCADCANLRTLVESFNSDHQLILPDDITWLGAFLYAAKLEECGIPY